jgi:hypothetical protein
MNRKDDSELIFEAYEDEAQVSSQPSLNGVSCYCDDCDSWLEGDKCTAPSIELKFGKNLHDETICECQTYSKK